MTCFVKEWPQLHDLERLGGKGALELNSQPCDESQRKIQEGNELPFQNEQMGKPTNELRSPES